MIKYVSNWTKLFIVWLLNASFCVVDLYLSVFTFQQAFQNGRRWFKEQRTERLEKEAVSLLVLDLRELENT